MKCFPIFTDWEDEFWYRIKCETLTITLSSAEIIDQWLFAISKTKQLTKQLSKQTINQLTD